MDSVDLCDGDQWKENVSLELYPYDAGTDSGFTFSSPNFETIPQDKITKVGQPESSATSFKAKITNKGHKLFSSLARTILQLNIKQIP